MFYHRYGDSEMTPTSIIETDIPPLCDLRYPLTAGVSYLDAHGVRHVVLQPLTDEQRYSRQRLVVGSQGNIGLLTRTQVTALRSLLVSPVRIQTNCLPEGDLDALFYLDPALEPDFTPFVPDLSFYQYRLTFQRLV